MPSSVVPARMVRKAAIPPVRAPAPRWSLRWSGRRVRACGLRRSRAQVEVTGRAISNNCRTSDELLLLGSQVGGYTKTSGLDHSFFYTGREGAADAPRVLPVWAAVPSVCPGAAPGPAVAQFVLAVGKPGPAPESAVKLFTSR